VQQPSLFRRRPSGHNIQPVIRPEMGAVSCVGALVYLLQRHKHLNDAIALRQRLQRLPNNRTKHSVPIGSFHRMALCGRSHQEVAYPDWTIFCRNFTRYDPHDGQRNFIVWC
jgi:hypothetical protein